MTQHASSLAAEIQFAGDAARGLTLVDDAELRRLRLFCVVVAAGGLSAATAELQSDLSTVSRQFKELEARVGTRLAHRGRGGFQLTEAGLRLHQAALPLLGALRSFRDEVEGIGGAVGTLLRLGVVDALLTAPHRPLPGALAACFDAMPGLRLELQTLLPIEIERRILASELDAGIVAAHTAPAGLQQQHLFSEPSSVYVAPGHPWFRRCESVDESELADTDWVADPYSIDLPVPALAEVLRGSTRAGTIEGVAMLVATGRFAGVLPEHFVEGTRTLAGLRRVRPERLSYAQDIVLTCRQGKTDAAVRLLARQLAMREPVPA